VKKNNWDNELSAERERTMKAHLQNANRTIRILRIQCKDSELLEALEQESVPESTAKTTRLDECTYIRDKMAVREAAAGLTTLFDNAEGDAEAEADI
jgi:16S rRNA C967 or C1407 C5-methylase (RsmB/RsmF family)